MRTKHRPWGGDDHPVVEEAHERGWTRGGRLVSPDPRDGTSQAVTDLACEEMAWYTNRAARAAAEAVFLPQARPQGWRADGLRPWRATPGRGV